MTTVTKENKTRKQHRTPQQIIADLEAKIKDVKRRAAAKESKKSGSAKRAIMAIRALDKGMDQAKEDGDPKLRHAFAEARKILAEQLTTMGIPAPQKRMPRGPKPA